MTTAHSPVVLPFATRIVENRICCGMAAEHFYPECISLIVLRDIHLHTTHLYLLSPFSLYFSALQRRYAVLIFPSWKCRTGTTRKIEHASYTHRTQIEHKSKKRNYDYLRVKNTIKSMKSGISMMTNSAIHLVPSTKRTDPICLLRLRNRYPIFQKVAIVCTFFFLFSFFCSIVSKRQRPLESTTSY